MASRSRRAEISERFYVGGEVKFDSHMFKFLPVLIGPVANRAAGQRGFSTLTLSLIGLIAGSALAVPALQLAVGALATADRSSASNHARSAAEHALWRLKYDPTLHSLMTGSPPATDYILSLPNGNAGVNIAASSDPPPNEGLRSSIVVSPTVIEPGTPTEVMFTLTLINDDVVPHDVTRFRAVPLLFPTSYVTGSTTGATTTDPSLFFGIYTWDLISAVSVPGFGGTTSITWRMNFDLPEGQYWTEGIVSVTGSGSIFTPLDAYVRAVVINDIDVSTTVAPNSVSAGSQQTFRYTVTFTNNGPVPYTVEWLKHYVPN
ncbi:MAG: hypothetical protein O3B95_06225 [Chloroflexi bacterium]|nr:hypothetical protein [Chloroflexota bacterium]